MVYCKDCGDGDAGKFVGVRVYRDDDGDKRSWLAVECSDCGGDELFSDEAMSNPYTASDFAESMNETYRDHDDV